MFNKEEFIQDIDKKKKDSAKEIKKYEEKIKELINLDKPSRELLQSIIDKIIIDKDRNIEIFYKFSLLNNIWFIEVSSILTSYI